MRAVLLFLIFAACTTAPKTSGTASADRDRLFPFGTYRHKIGLSVSLEKGGTRDMSFDGVVELRAEKVQVIGLSPFGTTEFKITESGGKIEIETFRAQLKKAEPRFLEYYSVLRRLFGAKFRREAETELVWGEGGSPGPMLLLDSKSQSSFKLLDYDSNAIPLVMEIVHPKFSARIQVAGYEI
ncbi:MAG: hypothetical protein ABL958_07650 [Bdellovibrionia bacterium]